MPPITFSSRVEDLVCPIPTAGQCACPLSLLGPCLAQASSASGLALAATAGTWTISRNDVLLVFPFQSVLRVQAGNMSTRLAMFLPLTQKP